MIGRSTLGLPLLVGALAFGCAGPAQEHGEAGGDDAPAEETRDGGSLAHEDEPGTVPLAGVRGVSYSEVGEPQEEGVWLAAEAVADEASVVALTSPVSGIVVAFRAAPGEHVAAGAPLAQIRSPELADLKAAWLTARARSTRAEADASRERRLLAGQATAQRDLEAAEADAAVARAEEEAARLALAARGIAPETAEATLLVNAPRSGTLSVWNVILGQGIEAGEELGRLLAGPATLARVELPLPVPESWTPGASTEVRSSDGRRWAAAIAGVPMALSADTRRLAYRLRLEGEALPLAGTPLEARVPLAKGIVLPQTALQQVEGVWGVFVRTGSQAVFRPVRRGAELGGDVLVLEGLTPGEVVASDGAYLLKALYLKLSAGGEAHEH